MSGATGASAALAGKRIVVTRARHQAADWEAVIRQFGALPIAYPCLAIAPPTDAAEFDRCLQRLNEYDWLALSSGNAVRAVAERARILAVLVELNRMKIAALGPSTAAEVRRQIGKAADFVPSAFSADGLAREMPIGKRQRYPPPAVGLGGCQDGRDLALAWRGGDDLGRVPHRDRQRRRRSARDDRQARNRRADIRQSLGSPFLPPAMRRAGRAWLARALPRRNDCPGRRRRRFSLRNHFARNWHSRADDSLC